MSGGVPVAAHVPLDRTDRPVDVGDGLVLRGLADEHLAVAGEGDDRGRRARALGVGDDRRLAAFEDGDDGVGGPEVDADRTSHGGSSGELLELLRLKSATGRISGLSPVRSTCSSGPTRGVAVVFPGARGFLRTPPRLGASPYPRRHDRTGGRSAPAPARRRRRTPGAAGEPRHGPGRPAPRSSPRPSAWITQLVEQHRGLRRCRTMRRRSRLAGGRQRVQRAHQRPCGELLRLQSRLCELRQAHWTPPPEPTDTPTTRLPRHSDLAS